MRKGLIVPAFLALMFAGVVVVLADSPQMGTWKLNEAKSKFSPGAPKNHTVVYEAAGDSVKITVDGVDGDGNPTHNEWTGKWDGKYYPVTGDATSDSRAYKQVNNRTLTFTAKKGKKVTLTGRVVVSADGKVRTVTTRGINAKGKRVSTTAVFDKQ
jgi:hypothetical protein